jgi:hypothetical protein
VISLAERISISGGGARTTGHAGTASQLESTWTPDRLVAIPLMCVSLAVAVIVGFELLDARGIIQLDVWFHLDTDDLLIPTEFSELIRHPNLGLFVRRPVLLAARVLGWLGVGTGAPLQLFYWLILLVAPAAAAIRTLAAYRALWWLTRSVALASMLCLLDISAFASVAIGSVPESYPLSAACLAGSYWLLVTDVQRPAVRWVWWLTLGTLAVGITVTNIVPYAIFVGSLLLIRGVRLARVIYLTTAALAAVVGATIALVLASALLIGEPLGDRIDPSTEKYMGSSTMGDAAMEIGWAMAYTFITPRAQRAASGHTASDNPDHDYVLLLPTASIRTIRDWWRVLIPSVALALGVAGFLQGGRHAIWALPAALILAGNLGLHLLFGHHFFMYAMHWTFSLVWLMSGVAFLPGRMRLVGAIVVALLLLATAVNSGIVMQQLVAQLRAA